MKKKEKTFSIPIPEDARERLSDAKIFNDKVKRATEVVENMQDELSEMLGRLSEEDSETLWQVMGAGANTTVSAVVDVIGNSDLDVPEAKKEATGKVVYQVFGIIKMLEKEGFIKMLK